MANELVQNNDMDVLNPDQKKDEVDKELDLGSQSSDPEAGAKDNTLNLEDIYGLLPMVTAAPTWSPKKFIDAFAIDATNGRFYFYKFATQTWGYVQSGITLNSLLPSQTGNSGKYLGTDGSNASWNTFFEQTWMFGNGVDGDVTISSDTTLSTYKFYNNLTIDSGKYLRSAYPIYVKGTLTVNGALHNDGNNGGNASGLTGGTAGAAVSAGFFAGSSAGKAGANGKTAVGVVESGTNGTAGAAEANCISNNSSAGGDSGELPTIIAAATGGAGGTPSSNPTVSYQALPYIYTLYDQSGTKFVAFAGSGSGAAGPGRSFYNATFDYAVNTGSGGGSGSNAGNLVIFAKNIVIGASGRISCKGGDGGAGSDAIWTNDSNTSATRGAAGGGGGAGGSGGILVIFYNTLTNSGTITVNGGAGGAGGQAYSNGISPAPTNGVSGSAGYSGFLLQCEVN